MIVVKDTEYNNRYSKRPKRFIVADEGFGPTYITEDVIPTSIVRAQAELDKWKEIETIAATL